MCAVSAISDYYSNPNHLQHFNIPASNPFPSVPVTSPKEFDPGTKQMLQEVIRRLDEIDKRLGDRECMDDKKREFYDAIGYKEGE